MPSVLTNKQAVPDSDEVNLGRLVGELIDYYKFIISITVVFIFIAILYVLFATPVYQADALVQIEQKQGNTILNNMSQMLPDAQPPSAPEMALLQSRMILGKTVDDLNLQIQVEQKYVPLFGRGWARMMGKKPGKLLVSHLYLPTREEDVATITLTVLNEGHYRVTGNGFELTGQVGNLLKDKGIVLKVDKVVAAPGTKFTIQFLTKLQSINKLQESFSVADLGKDTGMLKLTLNGTDPILVAKILNRINQNYLAQNIAREAAQDAKSLVFLNNQLPNVRMELDAAEDKLNAFRQEKDSVDLSLETKAVLEQIISIDDQLNKLTLGEAEIAQFHTKAHPTYKTLMERRQTLQKEKDKLNHRISRLPATQQKILKLSRDVESNQTVYMQLLQRQQELNIAKSSAIGNVRIIDSAATQPIPVKPQKVLILILGMILGVASSIVLVLCRIFMRHGIESPEQLEESGIKVYASVPVSEWLTKANVKGKSKIRQNKQLACFLAVDNPVDLAIESLRGLRTSLYFEMMAAKNNILMISGATPGVGKTFISSNLAAVMTQTGKKILFIDADLRRGYAHQLFGASNELGLSEVLSEQASVDSVIKTISGGGFDFITRGQQTSNSAELLMRDSFAALLKWANQHYELVIIDTPPILAITDAAIIGPHAGVVLLVARFELTTVKEIEVSIRKFEQSGVFVNGSILNGVMKKARSYYSYGYNHYGYSYPEKSTT